MTHHLIAVLIVGDEGPKLGILDHQLLDSGHEMERLPQLLFRPVLIPDRRKAEVCHVFIDSGHQTQK